MKCHTE